MKTKVSKFSILTAFASFVYIRYKLLKVAMKYWEFRQKDGSSDIGFKSLSDLTALSDLLLQR